MIRNYRFAGIEISVDMPEDRIYDDEHRLGIFGVEQVENPYIYNFELVKELDEPIGVHVINQNDSRIYQDGEQRIRYVGSVQNTLDGAYICIRTVGKENSVQLLADKFPERIGAKTVLNALDIPNMMAQAGGFILHCSYIEWDGKAILFTAPSETGKSTQAELWKEFRDAEIINGDRAAVRVVDGIAIAEGIPFSGSSQYCINRSMPIEAIVYLGQAKETTICGLQGYMAFSKIWEGISVNSWDKNDTELVSGIVQKIAETVPVFYLQCTPDESAVIALENELRKKENA